MMSPKRRLAQRSANSAAGCTLSPAMLPAVRGGVAVFMPRPPPPEPGPVPIG
jgi:hypothetical protein